MKSTRKCLEQGIASVRKTLTRWLLAALLLACNALILLPAGGQQLEKPDSMQSFSVGSYPWGLTFDGANIWVTSYFNDNVTKLRASDGTLLGTFPAGGGTAF